MILAQVTRLPLIQETDLASKCNHVDNQKPPLRTEDSTKIMENGSHLLEICTYACSCTISDILKINLNNFEVMLKWFGKGIERGLIGGTTVDG